LSAGEPPGAAGGTPSCDMIGFSRLFASAAKCYRSSRSSAPSCRLSDFFARSTGVPGTNDCLRLASMCPSPHANTAGASWTSHISPHSFPHIVPSAQHRSLLL